MGNQSRLGGLIDLGEVLRWGLIVGAVAIVFSASPSPLVQIGVGMLIFLAAFAAGALLGFIFSVPKAVDPSAVVAPATPPATPPATSGEEAVQADGADAAPIRGRLLNTNTALERISEWLATMLVGVGLSQLYNVNNLLIDFRDFLKAYGPAGSTLPAIGPLILIAGVVAGFMFLYVYTRLILPAAFYKAEAINSGQDLDAAASQAVIAAAQAAVTKPPTPPANSNESVADQDIVSPAQNFTLTSIANTKRPSAETATALMLSLLYRPGGYAEVINLAAQLTDSAAAARADFWFYLACAFGQLHAQTPADAVVARKQARDQLLYAARRAIALDPAMKAQLWSLAQPGAIDDDLASLRDDPEVMALLR